MMHFQEMIAALTDFWAKQGCVVHQGYDLEVGAGTFNPATFLRCLGPEPYRTVYVEPSRRPQDGRYGDNPNRVQCFHQMQVIYKPSPKNLQDLYLQSLEAIGLKLKEHDVRFVHDDWENPTIGAWGLGWEVWVDGMEVSQYTYFQCVGGIPVNPVSGEITYGLERLAMFIQKKDSFFDLLWNGSLTYGDIFQRSELEWSHYNFNEADTAMWLRHFDDFEAEAKHLMHKNLPIPAYDFVMKASHAFNILDARGVISVTERTGYIGRIRALAEHIANTYIASREKQKFPLLNKEEEEKQIEATHTIDPSFDPEEKKDFLFEIGSEELPATFVPIGARNLKQAMVRLLQDEGLEHDKIEIFATPRRLACLVHGLSSGTKSVTVEKRGPSLNVAFDNDGVLTRAGAGFFRSNNLPAITMKELQQGDLARVEIRKQGTQEYLFAHLETPGRATAKILAQKLPQLIMRLDFPKKMRWGNFEIEYPRPLRWILALFGQNIVPFTLAGIVSGNASEGHPQMSPGLFTLKKPTEYVPTLKKKHVLVAIEERKASILKQLEALEKELHAKAVVPERVLPQVLYLTEWPILTFATFEKDFLKAPKEVLISEMVEHQKYFPLSDSKGDLIPGFVITCNNTPNDLIRKGNQAALFPRLADGVFLYEEDLKQKLSTFAEKLKTVTFQKELGTLYAKVERLQRYVEILQSVLPIAELKDLKRAAYLSKADLTTLLVGEFPELQGIAGKLYAFAQKEQKSVAIAIDEHWMPRGEKAPLPQSPTGIILSFADKIDSLLSCFSLGLEPTSSSDPYALRRQGLGMLKTLIEEKLHLTLLPIFNSCFEHFLENRALTQKKRTQMEENQYTILKKIERFLLGRLRTIFHEMQFGKDEVEAVLYKGLRNPYDTYLLLNALHEFRKDEKEFLAVHEIYTRAKKILFSQNPHLVPGWKIEALEENRFPEVSTETFTHPAERALYDVTQNIKDCLHREYADKSDPKTHDYPKAFLSLKELQKPVADFFDAVKVIDEDAALRQNRLALLQDIWDLCEELVDFSRV